MVTFKPLTSSSTKSEVSKKQQTTTISTTSTTTTRTEGTVTTNRIRNEVYWAHGTRPSRTDPRPASQIFHESLFSPRIQKARELTQQAVVDGVVDNSHVYFCKTKNPTFVQISPKQRFCHEDRYNQSSSWKDITITLYEKVSLPQPIKGNAYICTIKNDTVGYYTNLWGDPEQDPPVVKLTTVSNDTCYSYVNTRKCHKGKLTHRSEDVV